MPSVAHRADIMAPSNRVFKKGWKLLGSVRSRQQGSEACIPASQWLPQEWLLALGHTHPLLHLLTCLALQVFEFLTLIEDRNQS